MNNHQRRSIRLPHYNYHQAGAYFITISVHNKICLFGEITNGIMRLNDVGQLVVSEWQRTSSIRPNVELAQFIVMPNHIHGIIVIKNSGTRGVLPYSSETFRSPSQTVGSIVRGFKSATTKRINEMRQMPSAIVWQRNYYEHVVRNDDELTRIGEYS